MDRRFPVNALRAFEAVGRHCHVRRAAEELHLSHAALSRQVRLLEDHVGTAMFTREKNRMQLTPAGRRFLEVVQDIMATLQEGVLDLNPELLKGELVIATTATISINWLPGVLLSYNKRYPEVTLRVVTIEPFQTILPEHFDLALCLGRPEDRHKVVRRLYQEHYFPVAAPSLLSPDKPINRPKDILRYTLLQEQTQHWEAWFSLHALEQPKDLSKIHFDYGFQSIEAARLGLGVVLADRLEVAADLRRGTLVRLLDSVLPVDAGIYLVAEPEQKQSLRARLFIEELSRHLDQLGVLVPLVHDDKVDSPEGI